MKLVEVKNLKKYFPVEKGLFGASRDRRFVRAVDEVSFHIVKGETFGLVGESGCGKSTLAKLLLRLLQPDDGEVYFYGEDIIKLSKGEMRNIRKKIQIIFQDPFASLNPRMTIGAMLAEILQVHNYPREKVRTRISELMYLVGLNENDLGKYPHEFSGGQRQRIGIARALAVQPDFVVADEPVSSLDVSIQAQIVNLLMELQNKMLLTYLFISHDLALVRYVADRIAVMYQGQIMEMAEASQIYSKPSHPYTQILLSSLPKFYSGEIESANISQDMGISKDFVNLQSGCCFYPRCPKKSIECRERKPELKEISEGHFIRCF